MVDTVGPLATMWRSVYRKASEAAAAKMADLLRDHVYLFHRNLPPAGGGGAGGLVLVATQTTADATAAQIDFAAVPAAGAGLLLVVYAYQHVPGGSASAGSLLLRLNDDAGTNYWSKWHELSGTTTPPTQTIAGDAASYLPLGRLSFDDDASPDTAAGAAVAFLPGHGLAGRRKQVLSQGAAFTFSKHWQGDYGGEWRGTAAVTKLTLLPSGGTFGAGSVFTLYRFAQD